MKGFSNVFVPFLSIFSFFFFFLLWIYILFILSTSFIFLELLYVLTAFLNILFIIVQLTLFFVFPPELIPVHKHLEGSLNQELVIIWLFAVCNPFSPCSLHNHSRDFLFHCLIPFLFKSPHDNFLQFALLSLGNI